MDQYNSQYNPNHQQQQYNPGYSKPMMNPNSVNGNMQRPPIPTDQMANMHLSSNKQPFPPSMVPSSANNYPYNNMQPHYAEPHMPPLTPASSNNSQFSGQGAQVSTSQSYPQQSMPPMHSPFPPSFSNTAPNQNSYPQQANASSYSPSPPFPPTSASQSHGGRNGVAPPPTSSFGPHGMTSGFVAQQPGPPLPPTLGSPNNTQYGSHFPPAVGMQQTHGPPPPITPPSGLPPPPPKSGEAMGPSSNSSAGPLPPQAQPIPRGPQAPAPGPPAPAQRRLNADQMPSAVQVIEDDRNNRSGEFNTGNRSQAPPLVTTSFVAVDQGNCNPRFIRSSLYNVPLTADLLKQAGIPFSLTMCPFSQLDELEQAVPIGQVPTEGPVRCIRCKAYMCPFMTFIDGGRRFQCALCGSTTEIPQDYFAHLDHTGRRTDCYQRPELCLGSFELLATKEYCRNEEFPQAPAIIFMLDVSYNSIKNGLVNLFCQKIKEEILSYLPKEDFAPDDAESEMRVGFVTYDKQLHFYNLKSCLSQPQMQIVSDLDEVFVPLVDGFFVRVSEAEFLLDNLMEQIVTQFANNHQTETILAPVIEAGRQALEAAKRPGKLIVLHSSLPSVEAPGKLKNRDDRKLLGTDKEKTLLMPSSPYYGTLGQKCVGSGCSVDIFLFPNAYIDIASIAEVSKITGGNIYKYPYFQADMHSEALLTDLRQAVSEPRAFDCVMRVRTSTGTRPIEFYGNFYMSNTTDVEVGCFDRDKAITVEIRHDDKLQENDVVFIQTAILYTSVSGQRRLRIHNLSLSTTGTLTDLFRVAELDTAMNHLCKHTIQTLLNKSSRDCREEIAAKCSHILAAYRKHCTYAGNPGELILPEVMKLMPLYCNCLTKSEALQTMSDISTDDRSYNLFLLNDMNVKQSVAYLYPRVLPLHNLDPDSKRIPVALRASYERLEPNGAYLVENGVHLYLWLGDNISSTWVQSVFSVPSIAQLEPEKASVLHLDNPVSQRVRHVLKTVRSERPRFMKLHVVRQGDTLEHYFKRFMVEDRGDNGTPSYVDYLCHIHKEIRSLLN